MIIKTLSIALCNRKGYVESRTMPPYVPGIGYLQVVEKAPLPLYLPHLIPNFLVRVEALQWMLARNRSESPCLYQIISVYRYYLSYLLLQLEIVPIRFGQSDYFSRLLLLQFQFG